MIIITMLQAWRGRLESACRALDYTIVGSGRADGSTSFWQVAVETTAPADEVETALRNHLGFDGWMIVRAATQESSRTDFQHPVENMANKVAK